MNYSSLRDFIAQLEKIGQLKRISTEVDPHLEMTEIADRVLSALEGVFDDGIDGPVCGIQRSRPGGFHGRGRGEAE